MKLAALVGHVKSSAEATNRVTSDLYKLLDKPDKFSGLSRTYEPTQEEGERLPAETKAVEATVDLVLAKVVAAYREHTRLMITRDIANQGTTAALRVDGRDLTPPLPSTSIIAIEKILRDMLAVAKRIPTRDPQKSFTSSQLIAISGEAVEVGLTEPILSDKMVTREEPTVIVPATDKHPAQTAIRKVQEKVGVWTTRHLTGAWTEPQKALLIKRLETLVDACTTALTECNQVQIDKVYDLDELFKFITT